ncbi:MAG TPA: excinuclease ABC subunit UvrC [Planctomycetota bacterium]|nr:excinuclease ABC subunit UvrC [Planctomycetota bacterium]
MIPDKLQEKLAALPAACGVYLMKDRHNKVIYVGKAVNLRARVRSYFQASSDERVFVEHLVPRVADLDWVLVATEKEALILENNLIKQFKPRFNINLKDDKTFLSIKLDRRQPFPRLELVRRYTPEDGVRYFGPYSSAASARETLRIVNAIFPIRKTPDAVFRNRTRPCLYYELGRCVAPCVGYVDAAAYGELLDEVEMFLRGRSQELAERLRDKMRQAAARHEFEMAARYRDQLAAVERTIEKQVVASPQSVDRDVFGYYTEGETMQVQALLVRRGKLEDVPTYAFGTKGYAAPAAFEEFLKQFYGRTRFIPPEVLVPVEPPDRGPLTEWLAERRGGKVEVLRPQRGEKARLVEMAMRNAQSAFRAAHATERDRARVLERLQAALGLRRPPQRMECYDISNLGGAEAVGSQVTFDRGAPNKARYRRYRIKTVAGADDYAMLREVLTRRLRRGTQEHDLPDLIIVDGGVGQLAVAWAAVRAAGVAGVDFIALAKGREHTQERVFVPERPEPIVLAPDAPELHLLERIRDEAHRFAITYHHKLRRQPYKGSILDRIPGIGPARKKVLVAHFGSVRAIRVASRDELAKVEGVSAKQAAAIHAFFHALAERPPAQEQAEEPG